MANIKLISPTVRLIGATITALTLYYNKFYKNENVSAIINKFHFSEPDGTQLPWIEISFSNKGNRNAIISNVALCFPNTHGTNYCNFAFERSKQLEQFQVNANQVVFKKLCFPGVNTTLQEAKFFNEEYSWLNCSLIFTIINSDGIFLEKEFSNLVNLVLNKEKTKIKGSTCMTEIKLPLIHNIKIMNYIFKFWKK